MAAVLCVCVCVRVSLCVVHTFPQVGMTQRKALIQTIDCRFKQAPLIYLFILRQLPKLPCYHRGNTPKLSVFLVSF